jgi:hypothetical protein
MAEQLVTQVAPGTIPIKIHSKKKEPVKAVRTITPKRPSPFSTPRPSKKYSQKQIVFDDNQQLLLLQLLQFIVKFFQKTSFQRQPK